MFLIWQAKFLLWMTTIYYFFAFNSCKSLIFQNFFIKIFLIDLFFWIGGGFPYGKVRILRKIKVICAKLSVTASVRSPKLVLGGGCRVGLRPTWFLLCQPRPRSWSSCSCSWCSDFIFKAQRGLTMRSSARGGRSRNVVKRKSLIIKVCSWCSDEVWRRSLRKPLIIKVCSRCSRCSDKKIGQGGRSFDKVGLRLSLFASVSSAGIVLFFSSEHTNMIIF